MVKAVAFAGVVALLVIGIVPAADAVTYPPRAGGVSCAAPGSVAFAPNLQFTVKAGHDNDAHAKFKGAPESCSGAQTGGNPRRTGAIGRGKLVAKGLTTGHTCSDVSAHGVRAIKVKITWYDEAGANLGVTKIAAASATVSGMGNGAGSIWPPPNNPPPGIVTIAVAGTADATSTAFPGEALQATLVADQTVEQFALPCSNQGPPLKTGVQGFFFTGVQGPSTISVS